MKGVQVRLYIHISGNGSWRWPCQLIIGAKRPFIPTNIGPKVSISMDSGYALYRSAFKQCIGGSTVCNTCISGGLLTLF